MCVFPPDQPVTYHCKARLVSNISGIPAVTLIQQIAAHNKFPRTHRAVVEGVFSQSEIQQQCSRQTAHRRQKGFHQA